MIICIHSLQNKDKMEPLHSVNSGDSSEYETASEGELDFASAKNICINHAQYHQKVLKHSRVEGHLGQETEALANDADVLLLDWASEGASLDPGRRRKLSKKQKRKKRNKICDTFDIEALSMNDITSDTIDDAFSFSNKTRDCTGVQRPVASLSELCARALERRSKSGIRRKRTASAGHVPQCFKQLISDCGEEQRTYADQLTFLQNHILPLCKLPGYTRPSKLGYSKTKPPRRSVFSADGSLPGEKVLSFLYSPPCGLMMGEGPAWQCHAYEMQITSAQAALAATIELMLPDNVKTSYHKRKHVTEEDAACKVTEANLMLVKNVLTKSGATVAGITECLFKSVVPYVMWARGNVTMATKFFQKLVKKAQSAHTRAMRLSEIAHMHAMFGDSTTAVNFYKLASTSVMHQHKYTEDILTDLRDQEQVLLASVADTGVLTEEKAVQSYNCWSTVMRTPQQSSFDRDIRVMAGIDAFLCYHASHWKETDWLSEGHARIAQCVSKHSFLHLYLSMLHALQGNDKQSKEEYKELYQSFMDFGEVNYPPGRPTNAWQPLVDIVSNQRSPVLPLNVVWRVQLQPSSLVHNRLLEAQVRSKELNLRLSESGHVTGDMQMLLPPMRDISMDPYTGSLVINSTQSKTRPWKTAYFQPEEFHTSGLLIPTPSQIYSGSSGTTVHMVMPCNDGIVMTTTDDQRPVTPFKLYWRDGTGHSAKLNMYRVLQNFLKEACKDYLYNGKPAVHGKEVYDHVVELAMSKNLSLSVADLRHSANRYCQEKDKNVEPASKPGSKYKRMYGCAAPKPKQATPKPKQAYMHTRMLYFKLLEEPFVFGKTIVLYMHVPSHSESLLVFIRTCDRESFLHPKIYKDNNAITWVKQGRDHRTDAQFFMHTNYYYRYHFYNEDGDSTIVVDLDTLSVWKHLNESLNPVIIGANVHAVDKKRRRIWKLNVLLEVDSFIFDNLTTTALDSCWAQIEGSEDEKGIVDLTVIGREVGGVRKLILINMGGGFAFMDPVSMELIDICVAEMGSSANKLSTDHKAWLGHSSKCQVKLLCEKSFMRGDQAVDLLTVGCDGTVALFEISQNAGQDDVVITLTNSLVVPGFVKEACYIGKAEILVSTSLHQEDSKYYREHLLHFRLDGLLYGMLPCLGHGPRSFLPVYLYGDEGQGQAGWYVYMRDGHHGIIGVRLHG